MKGIIKLQGKWGVGAGQFWLIILTFALGGSLSGRLTSYLLKLVFLEKNGVFWLIYPLLLTILWPISVIFVSFFTGQFRFFKGYLGRVGAKLFGGASMEGTLAKSASPIHVAIFASGAGSNARKIIEYFENSSRVKVSLIVCNVPGAGVLDIAKEKGIPTLLINKGEFVSTGYVQSLRNAEINFIVLAGFLWKVPEVLVRAFAPSNTIDNNSTRGIINIHPALLPKYGGKGMYGARVHEAVIAAGEKTSGITIHWVNEHYDEGAIIYQATCSVEPGDTPNDLANKIHALEHAHFAPTIEKLLMK
jgi:folate-dependent phosphoribosylglycinamide formyltransferase PurN